METGLRLVRDGEKTERSRRWTFPSCSGMLLPQQAGLGGGTWSWECRDRMWESNSPGLRPAGENLL